jgi:hypothetical protein
MGGTVYRVYQNERSVFADTRLNAAFKDLSERFRRMRNRDMTLYLDKEIDGEMVAAIATATVQDGVALSGDSLDRLTAA